MKLGVFDSGIGGEAVAAALRATYPDAKIVTVNDKAHVPYGNKTPTEVLSLTKAALQPLLSSDCDIIILACNTATALTIVHLRKQYPQQKFIGIEPMIKTAAALTKTGTIAVCATPATLKSNRYHDLLKKYGSELKVIEPNCATWAYMIECDQINHDSIKRTITNVCDQGADVIVLGCTHYHWLKENIILATAGRAAVLEPSEAIGRRIQQLLTKS
jgi:glutamate racemase